MKHLKRQQITFMIPISWDKEDRVPSTKYVLSTFAHLVNISSVASNLFLSNRGFYQAVRLLLLRGSYLTRHNGRITSSMKLTWSVAFNIRIWWSCLVAALQDPKAFWSMNMFQTKVFTITSLVVLLSLHFHDWSAF